MKAWSVFFVLALLALVPVAWTPAATGAEADNPRANFWRVVRQGQQGYSAVSGQETGVLIQNGGENWRMLRNGPVAGFGAWLLAATVLALGLILVFKGPVRIEGGRSGRTVPRWSALDRVVHWSVAVLFLLLALTGLCLLFGRELLIPLLGRDAFSLLAAASKSLHNYLGPLFGAVLLLMIAIWLRRNLFNAADANWLARAGGLLGKGHPPAGFLNAGEKIWFWFVALGGLAVVVTGLVLDFPNFGQTRETMQLAHLVHAGVAALLIAGSLGHMYIGSIGTEGALEGMTGGRVDSAWAGQHHDLWVDELRQKGVTPEPVAEAAESEPRKAQPQSP